MGLNKIHEFKPSFIIPRIFIFLMAAVVLYLLSVFNFPLFHSYSELSVVSIMIGIFLIIWNAYSYIDNHYFVLLGIAFLFTGQLGILHALAYDGLAIFHLEGVTAANLATQLWLVSRYVLAGSLALAPLFINRKTNPVLIVLGYVVVIIGLLASIFLFRIFPTAFIEGQGLTSFKILSEYFIIALFVYALIAILVNRQKFESRVISLMALGIGFNVVSEVIFSLYHNVSGHLNFLGHIIMIAAFYFLYRAIAVTSLIQPHKLFYRNAQLFTEKLKRNDLLLRERGKQLERERDEDEALLASIADGVVAVNTKGRILYTNRAFAKMFDGFHGSLRGKHLKDITTLYHEDDTPINLENRPYGVALKSGKNKIIKESNIYYKKSDGSRVELVITAAPIISLSRVSGVIAVYQDVTDEKLIEKSKSEFISFAAHQLRTPLSTLQLTAEIIKDKITGDLETKKLADDIIKDIKTMTKIVDSFLNISRIEMGMYSIEPEPTAVVQEIEEIIDRSQTQILLKNLKLKRFYDKKIPIINIDERVFNTVVENIMTNSIKYTPVNGTLIVEVSVKEPNLIIQISDTGPGIPKANQNRVFDKMYRGNNVRRGEGAGLGLYIVKSLIRQAGGRVWCKSPAEYPRNLKTDQPGTTFFISIPLKGMKAKEMPKKALS